MFYFISVIVKGSSVSNYYRFIGKNCQWVWMQTRATIIYNTSNVPQYIVCMNYIIRSVGQSILFIKSYEIILYYYCNLLSQRKDKSNMKYILSFHFIFKESEKSTGNFFSVEWTVKPHFYNQGYCESMIIM